VRAARTFWRAAATESRAADRGRTCQLPRVANHEAPQPGPGPAPCGPHSGLMWSQSREEARLQGPRALSHGLWSPSVPSALLLSRSAAAGPCRCSLRSLPVTGRRGELLTDVFCRCPLCPPRGREREEETLLQQQNKELGVSYCISYLITHCREYYEDIFN